MHCLSTDLKIIKVYYGFTKKKWRKIMNQIKNRKTEQGNVLFLILIAVALFAALSYAVTQSTRSGGGSAEREKSVLSSASLVQYPASLRTSLIRMILNGTSVDNLEFNVPSAFGSLTSNEVGVFHPSGGAAVYQRAPAEVMANSNQADWYFNGSFEIPEIGISGAGGNDIIAFLPGVSRSVCVQLNKEVGINITGCTMTDGVVPDINGAAVTEANFKVTMDDSYTLPTTDQEDIAGIGGSCAAFNGQPTGCFNDTVTGEYVIYSVLLER